MVHLYKYVPAPVHYSATGNFMDEAIIKILNNPCVNLVGSLTLNA